MKKLSLIIALLLVAVVGCDSRPRTVTRTNVQTQTYLLDSSQFDLGTVTQLVRTNQVKNAQALEELVNSNSGINNVDLDNDGQIDYVAVVENTRGNLDFVAYHLTRGESGATTIAQLKISVNSSTNQVHVSGGYPSYVSGYDTHYYSYHVPRGPTLGQALFLSYMINSTRPVYHHNYSYYSARPSFRTVRRVYSPTVLRSTRTTYRTRTKVKPATVIKRPKTYTIKSASKTRSRLAATRKARGSSLSGRSGTMRSYTKRSSTKAKSRGSAFGSSSTRRKSTSTRKSSSWGSSSRKKSSSWGSSRKSTPTRKSSSWGSSSRKKSSWGSSRSRSRSSRSRSRRR